MFVEYVQSATISSNNPFADILQTTADDTATDFDFFETTPQPATDADDPDLAGAAAASTNNPFLFGAAADNTGGDDPWANTGAKKMKSLCLSGKALDLRSIGRGFNFNQNKAA